LVGRSFTSSLFDDEYISNMIKVPRIVMLINPIANEKKRKKRFLRTDMTNKKKLSTGKKRYIKIKKLLEFVIEGSIEKNIKTSNNIISIVAATTLFRNKKGIKNSSRPSKGK